ncbi:MAG: replicative DNA helicase, partial [Christensenellaceae bacterium]|nr:replicative DNA helicase [Christensenellaceae bacterium]
MPDIVSRIPPHSIEAEQSILGSMMLSEHCALSAVEKLNEEDFYTAQHRRLYAAMYDLIAMGKPVDMVTVVERLEMKKKLTAEELTYVTELTQRVPSVRNIDSYIQIVKEKSLLRRMIEACGEISDMCFSS